MKINNPTKIASRRILLEKMSQYNTDEENRIIMEQVEKHNQQTGDNLLYFELKTFTYTYNFNDPVIEVKRSVIPEKYQSIYKR